jgi:hypothetical protein
LTVAASLAHSEDSRNWIVTDSGCKAFAPHPVEDLKLSWTGTCAGGYAQGEGTLTWNNGDVQQGMLRAGRLEGVLKEHWSNGNSYEGEVHAGVVTGRGKYYWANGDWYEGEFKDGHRDGMGVLYFANGNRYEGEFKGSHQEGLGTLFQINGARFEGDFKADRPDGQALVTYPNGDRYQGVYVDGHVDGRGIYTKANGERDVAFFKEHHGELALVSRIGPAQYEKCQDFCSEGVLACGGIFGTMGAINPPGQTVPGIDRYGQCTAEISQCVTSCKHYNPTVDAKGIIEIQPLQPPGDPQAPDAKTSQAGNVAPDFGTEQAAATAALQARLAQQQQQLAALRQQVAERHGAVLAMASTTAATSAAKCRGNSQRK